MSKQSVRVALFASAFAAALLCAPLASSAGKGVGPGLPALDGVVTPGGDVGYSAYPTGGETVVIRINRGEVQPARSTVLRQRLILPAVAADGTGTGISADGSTLVLAPAHPSGPPSARETLFAVLDAMTLRQELSVKLPGAFTLDAVSPDGSVLYLIEYTDRRDPTQYLVRAYDRDAGRLDPDPIIDPNESAEDMSGYPMTRAMSPDGRWAYTLYDGEEHPFIHALDTQAGTARCIDLPHDISSRDLFDTDLAVSTDGSTLTVEQLSGPVAVVDTETFEVSEPGSAPPTAAPAEDAGDGTSWASVGVLGAASLLAIGAFGVVRARGRRRPAE